MFSAVLLSISIVAMLQFALYYWRAVLAGVAMQPLSERLLETIEKDEAEIGGNDFEQLASWLDLAPVMKAGSGSLGPVRTYFRIVRKAEQIFGTISPAFA